MSSRFCIFLYLIIDKTTAHFVIVLWLYSIYFSFAGWNWFVNRNFKFSRARSSWRIVTTFDGFRVRIWNFSTENKTTTFLWKYQNFQPLISFFGILGARNTFNEKLTTKLCTIFPFYINEGNLVTKFHEISQISQILGGINFFISSSHLHPSHKSYFPPQKCFGWSDGEKIVSERKF